MSEDDVIDLDALAPKTVRIKYGDAVLSIPPPQTGDLLRVGAMSKSLEVVNEMTNEELEKRVTTLTTQIYKMIPDLEGKPLGLAQLQMLVKIMSDMAMPEQMKALARKGITADTVSKAPPN